MMRFTVGVLCFGDYPHLAYRCLSSLRRCTDLHLVADLRLGLNEVSPGSLEVINQALQELRREAAFPIRIYRPARNVGKYPLMRRMFWDEAAPLAEAVAWFDDDAYVQGEWALFTRAAGALSNYAMAGLVMRMDFRGQIKEYIRSRPWFNPDAGFGVRDMFHFCQGSFWVMRTQVLRELDWPWPYLHHVGGDTLLGEQLRHTGKLVTSLPAMVAYNCDDRGQQHRSPRRGIGAGGGAVRLGEDYQVGDPDAVGLQDFPLDILEWSHGSSDLAGGNG